MLYILLQQHILIGFEKQMETKDRGINSVKLHVYYWINISQNDTGRRDMSKPDCHINALKYPAVTV